jgi:hypothetical protein
MHLSLSISGSRISRLHHSPTSAPQPSSETATKRPQGLLSVCVTSPHNRIRSSRLSAFNEIKCRNDIMHCWCYFIPVSWTSLLIKLWRCITFISYFIRSLYSSKDHRARTSFGTERSESGTEWHSLIQQHWLTRNFGPCFVLRYCHDPRQKTGRSYDARQK